MSDQVILYDLPSYHKEDRTPSCFSFNPWKSRSILNYKKIPYKTEFIECKQTDMQNDDSNHVAITWNLKPRHPLPMYDLLTFCPLFLDPDFEPVLKGLGVPPQGKDAFAPYTSPTIRFPDGTFVVESNNCAEALESRYPEPTLHLDEQLHRNIMAKVDQATQHIFPLAMIIVCDRLLSKRSSEFFLEDRKRRFGASMQDLATYHGEDAWKAGEAPGGAYEQLKDELHKHKKDRGPFVLGSKVSYGDLIMASMFESVERVDKQLYDRLIGYDESFGRLHNECRPWLERDN